MKSGIIFLGTDSLFSQTALSGLLQNKLPLCAIIMAHHQPEPEIQHTFPIAIKSAESHTIQQARLKNINITYLSYFDEKKLLNLLNQHPFRWLLMACFPYFLPASIYTIKDVQCINCHPSLLPAFKGADPIFWQLREGADFGISLHEVTQEVDSGDIYSQQTIHLAEHYNRAQIETQLAKISIQHFIKIAHHDYQKSPQNKTLSTYQSIPTALDYQLNINWTAQHAFRFISGTKNTRFSHAYHNNTHHLNIADTTGYDHNKTISSPQQISERQWDLPFAKGVLHAME